MKMLIPATAAFMLLGGSAFAQNEPSRPKEEPGPGSAAQEGTGSSPTLSPPPTDQSKVPSTKDSEDNKNYGRETDADGPSLEQGNPKPAP